MEMKYKLIYANRKTVSIRIDENGALMVRAPYFTSKNEIEKIIEKHRPKLEKMIENVLLK